MAKNSDGLALASIRSFTIYFFDLCKRKQERKKAQKPQVEQAACLSQKDDPVG